MQNTPPFNAPEAARVILGWSVDIGQAATEIAYSLSWLELLDAMHHLPDRHLLGHLESIMRSHIRTAIIVAVERELRRREDW